MLKKYDEIRGNFTIPRQHNGIEDSNKIEEIVIPQITYGLRTKKEYRKDQPINIKMDDWLKFLGIFVTDGSLTYDEKRGIYKVSIFQKNF